MTRHAGGRGRSRGRTEDRSRSANVHARLADPKQIGDLLRRKTAGDRAEDLTLTIG